MAKQKLVTLTEYIQLVKEATGLDISHQTLHGRRLRGALEFEIGGDTPDYKIDLVKFPPKKFKKEAPGRKAQTLTKTT